MSCYLCERWNWSRVFNLDFSAFSVIFSASLTKKIFKCLEEDHIQRKIATQVEKDNKQNKSRTPVHAKIEVAAGEVDPHRLKINFTVEVFTFYLGWGLCVSESFIFEHRAFVVAHVEGAVTKPQIHLQQKQSLFLGKLHIANLFAALATMSVELKNSHGPCVVSLPKEFLHFRHLEKMPGHPQSYRNIRGAPKNKTFFVGETFPNMGGCGG